MFFFFSSEISRNDEKYHFSQFDSLYDIFHCTYGSRQYLNYIQVHRKKFPTKQHRIEEKSGIVHSRPTGSEILTRQGSTGNNDLRSQIY